MQWHVFSRHHEPGFQGVHKHAKNLLRNALLRVQGASGHDSWSGYFCAHMQGTSEKQILHPGWLWFLQALSLLHPCPGPTELFFVDFFFRPQETIGEKTSLSFWIIFFLDWAWVILSFLEALLCKARKWSLSFVMLLRISDPNQHVSINNKLHEIWKFHTTNIGLSLFFLVKEAEKKWAWRVDRLAKQIQLNTVN